MQLVDHMLLDREWAQSPAFLVLLSCCDGAEFLPALLDSILGQDYTRHQILIRDDASRDGTLALLNEYARRSDRQITILPSSCEQRLGPRESFRQLLQHGLDDGYDVDFFLFADQDDVWLPHKLSSLAQRIGAEGLDASQPVLLHSDLRVVGRDLELLHPSYLSYQGLNARANRPGDIALVNTVTGCSMAISKALAERCEAESNERTLRFSC